MGPQILLDKSVLVSLSATELMVFGRYLSLVIPEILLQELLSELSNPENENPLRKLIVTSKKIPFDYIETVDFKKPCFTNLMGDRIEMTGCPLKDGGQQVIGADGSRGIVFPVSDTNKKLVRWSMGEILDVDRQSAELWRKYKETCNLDPFKKELKTIWPSLKMKSVSQVFDFILQLERSNEPLHKKFFLDLAIGVSGVNDIGKTDAFNYWIQNEMPHLSQYAPYSWHCVKVILSFFFGLLSDLVPTSKKASALIDLEYFYYLPFCRAFSSKAHSSR